MFKKQLSVVPFKQNDAIQITCRRSLKPANSHIAGDFSLYLITNQPQQRSNSSAETIICVITRNVYLVPVQVIIVSLMRHRELLLFTLAHGTFYCTLSASLTREIDSSVIGRYRRGERKNRHSEVERGKIMCRKAEERGN